MLIAALSWLTVMPAYAKAETAEDQDHVLTAPVSENQTDAIAVKGLILPEFEVGGDGRRLPRRSAVLL